MIDWLSILGNVLLFILVFGMSATVDVGCLRKQVRNRKAILTGMALQFVLLPFLGFITVKIIPMSQPMGLTLLVVTSSPGGSYSNWWCSMFNADLALSVTMTAVSTVMSIAMLPFNLLLYTRLSYDSDVLQELNWTSLVVAMIVVISAIGLGIFSSQHFHSHKFNLNANKVGNIAGISLILFSAILSNVGGGDVRIWNRSWAFYVGVALPCLLALILANVITTWLQLHKPERVTTSIECCYQNVGIATSIALAMYNGADQAEAVGVPFYYGVVEAAFIGVYCIWAWKYGWTKAPADVSFWTMISTSYEILDAEKEDESKGTDMMTQPTGSVENKNVVRDSDDDLVTSYVQV